MLHYASELKGLKAMPGNRLELLKGNLKGCYSIQINDRWRVVFKLFASWPLDKLLNLMYIVQY